MITFLTRIKIGAVIAAIILVGVAFMNGGAVPTPKANIQIDYGMDPDQFEGLPVQVDGEYAGTLKPEGNGHRTGFNVRPGRHSVKVLCQMFDSRAKIVEVHPGVPVILVLDYENVVGADGRLTSQVTFQN